MGRRLPILLCLSLIILLGTYCGAPRLQHDYDTQQKFRNYETFSWLDPEWNNPQIGNLVETHLHRAVARVLTEKGLRQLPAGGDLIVKYYVGQKAPVQIADGRYSYWPEHWSWGGYYEGAEQYEFPKGTLIIDLVDRSSRQLAWRGSATGVLSGGSEEKIVETIPEVVSRVLAVFPPDQ